MIKKLLILILAFVFFVWPGWSYKSSNYVYIISEKYASSVDDGDEKRKRRLFVNQKLELWHLTKASENSHHFDPDKKPFFAQNMEPPNKATRPIYSLAFNLFRFWIFINGLKESESFGL